MSGAPGGQLAAAARCLALDAHATRVVRALDEQGVPSVLVKGPGLARRLYAPDPGRRRYSDVDVLVRPTDFDRAETVLRGLGHRDVAAEFPLDEWLLHERSWRHPDGLTVDLHRGFAGVDDADVLVDLLLGHTEPLELAGGVVRVPDLVGCALLVALHAASPGRGRKALLDLTLALQQWPHQTWVQASSWAVACGAGDSFAAGLRRLPDGAALVLSLDLTPAPTRLARLAERLDLVLLHQSLRAVRLLPGHQRRWRYVVRRLAPTPGFLQHASGLARRGRLGLAAAYVVRPLRLLLPGRRPGRGRRGAGPALHRSRLGLHPRRWSWTTLDAAWWTLRALRRTRRSLARSPLAQVELPPPPLTPQVEATVRRTLARGRATCLERAVVLQRWRGAQGDPVDLVIGVTAPSTGFRAHAWLASDDDAEHSHSTMTVLVRRPTPAAWLPAR